VTNFKNLSEIRAVFLIRE